jgi:hypothetical protein
MQKAIVFAVLFFGFLSLSFGEKQFTPAELKKACSPKKRATKKIKYFPAMVIRSSRNFAAECCRAGGKWQDGLCYKQIVEPIVPVREQAVMPVVIKQEQNIILQPAESKKVLVSPIASSAVSPAANNKNEKWWWIGPGIWAMGLWAGEKDFVAGPYGTLIFAINHRFRVAGFIGAGFGPWQKDGITNVWLGGYGAVRAYNGLFINFGVETVWGGFDGLSVYRRMLAVSAGPEYWFNNRASISLRFLVGVRDDVRECLIKSGQITGGNIFTTALYF